MMKTSQYSFSTAESLVESVSREVSKHTEATLLAQLNDFISSGLIVIEYGPERFYSSDNGLSVSYSRSVNLRLKDREYVERLERENSAFREQLASLIKIISG